MKAKKQVGPTRRPKREAKTLAEPKGGEVAIDLGPRLTRVVGLEIVKPLGTMTWSDLGARLRDMRDVSHRLMNSTITACALADANGERGLQTLAYRAANAFLERERASAQAAAAKLPDGDRRADKLARMGAFALPGSLTAQASFKAEAEYQKWRKVAWRGERTLTTFRHGAPIFVRGDAWGVRREGGQYLLSVKLFAGRTGSVEMLVAADGGSAHAHMRRMLEDDGAKRADLKIVYLERKKKWLALLAYSYPAPTAAALDQSKMLAAHRGIRSFITYATADGETGVLADGGDILAAKGQFDRRKRSLQRHRRELGSGAKGHGVNRRAETYRALEDKEARFVKTKCQQIAAALVKRAVLRGCGVVLIEDYGAKELADNANEATAWLIRQWPFAQLKGAIANACAGAGVALREVASEYISSSCPKCGNVDATQDSGRGTFRCSAEACGIERGTDAVAAWNMLRSAGGGDGFRAHEKAVEAFVGVAKAKKRPAKTEANEGAAE